MAKKPKLSDEALVARIHFVRGQKVMLDRDLAQLYSVQTRDLNKAVKRNLRRFPPDFMFRLKPSETRNLMFQIGDTPDLRLAIAEGRVADFARGFLARQQAGASVP